MRIDEGDLRERTQRDKVQKDTFQGTNCPGKGPKTGRLMEQLKQKTLELLMETHFPECSKSTTADQEWKAVATL